MTECVKDSNKPLFHHLPKMSKSLSSLIAKIARLQNDYEYRKEIRDKKKSLIIENAIKE